MRIISVLFSFPPVYSGATKFWLRMIPRLEAYGINVDLLYRKEDGEFVHQTAEGTSTPVAEPFGTRRGTYYSGFLTVFKFLWSNRHRYSSAFFLGCTDALFATLSVKPFTPLRFVYRMTMLGEDDPIAIRKSGRFGWLRARLLRRIDGAICINPAMATNCFLAGIPKHRVFTIPQGTDIGLFSPATLANRNSIREKESLPLDAKVVIFCGTVVERKGVDLLMKAWPEVVAAHPSALLLLVGPNGSANGTNFDDPGDHFLHSMTQLSQTAAYRQSVRFLGYRENIRDLLQAADLFVLPSRMEGTPNVLLEAMATSLPIAISDLAGVSDVFVRNEMEALVFPQNDWEQLRECLLRFLGDREMAQRFGERARERVVNNFSFETVSKQYADVFKRF